ncbi:unnamed protein product [Cyprideis torosa]|uniref:Uncharacterized protein n=1 Tax=Cyprideis torosa TaxID=163714 RepID=A0A7R8W606_9CRUS|nr:unnamed protein product [Cyprideis torosa]CAG0885966.1 unnamed protein product [Cyprideis torosa]
MGAAAGAEPHSTLLHLISCRPQDCQMQPDSASTCPAPDRDPARVFTNNIIVRFHAGLELDGDEVKTIVCKYPPPNVVPPVAPIFPVIQPTPPPAETLLGEVEILMIICAILFMIFLLMGMACSYFFLKKRRVKIIRRTLPSEGSEISKLSGSTLFLPRIPRAHAASTTGSEETLVSSSETIPSDYPSESPSEIHSETEEIAQQRAPSVISEPLSSVYSDAHLVIEQEVFAEAVKHKLPRPDFNVAVRIKKGPKDYELIIRRTLPSEGSEISKLSGSTLFLPRIPRAHAASTTGSEETLVSSSETIPSDYPSESPSEIHSETEEIAQQRAPSVISEPLSSVYSDAHLVIEQEVFAEAVKHKLPRPDFNVAVRIKKGPKDYELMKAQEKALTTILEREESRHSDEQASIAEAFVAREPPLEPEVLIREPPATLSARMRLREETILQEAAEETSSEASSIRPPPTPVQETFQQASIPPPPPKRSPPPPPPSDYQSEARSLSSVEFDTPVAPRPKAPELTTHVVDDRYLRTLTDTLTLEELERRSREVKELHSRPRPRAAPWDVTIQTLPGPPVGRIVSETESTSSGGDDAMSSRASERALSRISQSQYSAVGSEKPRSLYDMTEDLTREPEELRPRNWDVLIRVLSPPPIHESASDYTDEDRTRWELVETLSDEDREKWRRIITTESTLRTLLTEAVVEEDFQRIRKDTRYEKLFTPRKWDVLIRVLSTPGHDGSDTKSEDTDSSIPGRYRRQGSRAPSSRRTPSEYSDVRSRRTSRSSLVHDGADLRSVTEYTVSDYARGQSSDTEAYSEWSGPSRPRSDVGSEDHTRFSRSAQVHEERYEVRGGSSSSPWAPDGEMTVLEIPRPDYSLTIPSGTVEEEGAEIHQSTSATRTVAYSSSSWQEHQGEFRH